MRDGSLQAATTTHQSHSAGMPARLQKRLDDTHGGRSAEQGKFVLAKSDFGHVTRLQKSSRRSGHVSSRDSTSQQSLQFLSSRVALLKNCVQGVYTHAESVAAAPRLEDLVTSGILSKNLTYL